MSDRLDEWYQRELDYFRQTASEFAHRFPKIANRLSLSGNQIRDPHVERLIQAFAYLNARTRHKLDDSFPELANAMLEILYPHMVSPVPSMTILQLQLSRAQKELLAGASVPSGRIIESEPVNGYQCPFRTCYGIHLFPISVDSVELLSAGFSGPQSPRRSEAAGALRFEMSAFDPAARISQMPISSLRFFINIANFEKAARLLEAILTQGLEVTVSDGEEVCRVLPSACIRAVGFDPGEEVIPQDSRSFPGYRLLTEYFVLPQKFLFFEITGLTPEVLAGIGSRLQLSILLKESPEEIIHDVSAETVLTGCTPAINLFQKTADAVPLNHRKTEYRIIPDARAEDSMEIHSVLTVDVEDDQGRRQFQPFYSVQHTEHSENVGYWHATRRPGPVEVDVGHLNQPAEMWVALVDPLFHPRRNYVGRMYASLMCFNRDLPEELSRLRTTDQIRMDPSGGRGPLAEVKCLVPPTKVERRHLGRKNLWPLVSQLSLNHLTLTGDDDAVEALKEIILLNDVRNSRQTQNLVNGLRSVSCEAAVQRIGRAFARGTQVNLLIEDENFAGDSAWLFSCVLNQFFGMYTSINSFTRLYSTTISREAQDQERWTWPPQTGSRALI